MRGGGRTQREYENTEEYYSEDGYRSSSSSSSSEGNQNVVPSASTTSRRSIIDPVSRLRTMSARRAAERLFSNGGVEGGEGMGGVGGGEDESG